MANKESLINQIERSYNPDHDIGDVTWADAYLRLERRLAEQNEPDAGSLGEAGPVCETCGRAPSEADVEAGETTCLDCAAGEVEIDFTDGSLLAVVRARLTAEIPQSDSSSTSSTDRKRGKKPAGRDPGAGRVEV